MRRKEELTKMRVLYLESYLAIIYFAKMFTFTFQFSHFLSYEKLLRAKWTPLKYKILKLTLVASKNSSMLIGCS